RRSAFHRAPIVRVQAERVGFDPVLGVHSSDQLGGGVRALCRPDLSLHDAPAPHVDEEVEVVEGPLHRSREIGDVPAPQLVRALRDDLLGADDRARTARTARNDKIVLAKNPVERRLRRDVDPEVGEPGDDLLRSAAAILRLVRDAYDLGAFGLGQRVARLRLRPAALVFAAIGHASPTLDRSNAQAKLATGDPEPATRPHGLIKECQRFDAFPSHVSSPHRRYLNGPGRPPISVFGFVSAALRCSSTHVRSAPVLAISSPKPELDGRRLRLRYRGWSSPSSPQRATAFFRSTNNAAVSASAASFRLRSPSSSRMRRCSAVSPRVFLADSPAIAAARTSSRKRTRSSSWSPSRRRNAPSSLSSRPAAAITMRNFSSPVRSDGRRRRDALGVPCFFPDIASTLAFPASRSQRDSVGWEIPTSADSAVAVVPPGPLIR